MPQYFSHLLRDLGTPESSVSSAAIPYAGIGIEEFRAAFLPLREAVQASMCDGFVPHNNLASPSRSLAGSPLGSETGGFEAAMAKHLAEADGYSRGGDSSVSPSSESANRGRCFPRDGDYLQGSGWNGAPIRQAHPGMSPGTSARAGLIAQDVPAAGPGARHEGPPFSSAGSGVRHEGPPFSSAGSGVRHEGPPFSSVGSGVRHEGPPFGRAKNSNIAEIRTTEGLASETIASSPSTVRRRVAQPHQAQQEQASPGAVSGSPVVRRNVQRTPGSMATPASSSAQPSPTGSDVGSLAGELDETEPGRRPVRRFRSITEEIQAVAAGDFVEGEIVEEERIECAICHRKFVASRIGKHKEICTKASQGQERRGKFDAASARKI